MRLLRRTPGDVDGRLSGQDSLLSRVEEILRRYEVASAYEILGIAPDATPEQIQTAYHDLAKEFHPDRFQGAQTDPHLRRQVETLFTIVNGAYTTLGSPTARANYDATRRIEESQVEATVRARAGAEAENDKMAETLFKAGRKALAAADFETAVARLKESVWLRPDVVRYRHSLGIAESEIPRLRKEAEQHLVRALEIDPMAVDSRLALARLYLKVALPRRAELQLAEVLRWDPTNGEARRLLEALHTRQR